MKLNVAFGDMINYDVSDNDDLVDGSKKIQMMMTDKTSALSHSSLLFPLNALLEWKVHIYAIVYPPLIQKTKIKGKESTTEGKKNNNNKATTCDWPDTSCEG